MAAYTKFLLEKIYRTMLMIRLCEESLVDPILRNEIRCPVHLYTGQEAVATGVCLSLTDKDYVFGTHRSHGHYIAKGAATDRLIAEIYGKKTGCAGGRGGSMHLFDGEKGVLGAAPIVSGTISLAVGSALAIKIRNERKVAVSFFGDGAAGEGVLYESLNFAALKKLPVIFVCENNLYSTHLSINECRPNDEIFRIGPPFAIESHRLDGNDVLEVYEAAKKAVKSCKAGKGPVLLECLTYRFRGHVGPDDNVQGVHTDIRPQSEIDAWKKKDPIVRFKRYLLKGGLLSEKELQRIESESEKEISLAHDFARQSRMPENKELKDNVFKN